MTRLSRMPRGRTSTPRTAANAAAAVVIYVIRLRHDNGMVRFAVNGHGTARDTVRWLLGIEYAPPSAVLWVKRRPT